MDVQVEHFRDAGERDATGEWDYLYEGDLFSFSAQARAERDEVLKARIYVDTPTRASFIEERSKLERSLLTADAVEYLRQRGATEIFCIDPRVGYRVWWCAE